MHFLAVLAATQPALKFVNGGLEGAVERVGATLAANDRSTVDVCGDLHALAVLALTAIVLVGQLDVEAVDRMIDPLSPGELLPDIDAEVVGDLDVAAGHLDMGDGPRVGALAVGGGVRRLHGLG